MSTGFSEIALSKEEQKALFLLNKHCLIAEDSEANDTVKRLIRHELAEYFHTTYSGKPRIGVRLTGKGKDYLMYLNRESKAQKTQSIRYWITTAIAVVALIKSFMPEICAGLAWLCQLISTKP